MASGSVDLNINTENAEGVIPKLTQDKKRTVNSQVKTATKISVQAQNFAYFLGGLKERKCGCLALVLDWPWRISYSNVCL
jgi:hypothetical protein